MARQTSKFMVGLFTSLGVVLGVVAIIWVGATKYFEKGDRYVTYFDESVQGLQKDSAVKYRGVEVGRVETIRVAPDNKLIAVVMKINLKEDLTKTAVAQLKVAGITGLVFVELEGKKPKEPDQSPKLNFPAEYPVIASRPSDIQRIMSGVNVVMEKFTQMDTQGIFDQFKSTAAEVEIFFKGKRMRTIMTNVEGTTGNARDITGQINKMLAAGRVNDVLLEGKTALKEVQTAVVALREEMHDMNLPETVSRARAIAAEVGTTTENLRRTTENLEDFMRRINDRPSDLLFGKPPKGRWNEAPKP